MSPRSLLFCSNRETSQLLSRFLRDLRFEVEHCPEIFEAVKRLTAHPHELVVIDWDEGLEASFLLKTVRELKSNREAFVIALAKPEAVAAVRQAGANEVVTKAQVSQEIENSWVSSRDFLAGLERRFAPHVKPAPIKPQPRLVAELPRVPAPAMPAALELQKPLEPMEPMEPFEHLPTQPLAASIVQDPIARREIPHYPAPTNLTFTTLDDQTSRPMEYLQTLSANLSQLDFPGMFNSSRNVLLRRVAMVLAFFSVGYVASQPLSLVGASIAEIYQEAVGVEPASHHTARAQARPTAGIAQASMLEPELSPARSAASDLQIKDSQMKLEVTPLYNDPPRREAPLPSVPKLVDTSAASDSPEYPDPPPSSSTKHIPESLTSQFPGGAAIRNVAERISPAILGALEPVTLPGYLAEKLLVERVEPSYPTQALRSGLEGPVILQASIGKDGKIRNLKLVRGPFLLGEAAYEAVKQWRYQPYLLNGEAVETQTYVTVDFKLP